MKNILLILAVLLLTGGTWKDLPKDKGKIIVNLSMQETSRQQSKDSSYDRYLEFAAFEDGDTWLSLKFFQFYGGKFIVDLYPLEKNAQNFSFYEKREAKFGPHQKAINRLGQIEYLIATAAGKQCLLWHQWFGYGSSDARPTKSIVGNYCQPHDRKLDSEKISSILNSYEIKP